jgi:hypothetical protein
MTNPTSNFGWQMPTSTDLVTDLPADFEVFGQAVDTDFVDLLGGTTGQVLSKTSATDLDFTWINNDTGDITGVTAGTGITGGGTSGTVTVTNDMATTITAAGDIVVGTGSGTYDNLPIGTTAQVLTADTTVSPYKVKWATPGGAVVPILTKAVMGADFTTSSATYVDITGMTITRTPVSATNNIQIIATMNITPGADRITRFRLVYGATNSNIIGEYLLAKAGYNTTLTIVFNVTNVAATSTVFKMQMLTDGSTLINGNNGGYLNSFSVLEVY